MPAEISLLELTLRLLLAGVLGAMIGWDRERHEKAAGVRTMILVSVGSAAFMVLAVELTGGIASRSDGDPASFLDPTRVVAGVIGGIGFLGAGSIIQAGGHVKGLTTAATIWAAAGMGMASGAGQYALAAVLTGVVLVTLVAIRGLKGRVFEREERDEDR